MKRNPVAYLASPLGFSEIGKIFYYKILIPLVANCGFDILDPWVLTPQKIITSAAKLPYGKEKKAKWKEVNEIIGHNNASALIQCDLVTAIIDGTDVDSGTASEIGFAAALGKPVIAYRGDFRLACDNEGCTVNLQVEYFIQLHAGKIVTNLKDLEKHMKNFKKVFEQFSG